ncbi:orotidine-5'-phosphate decarboxylase [Streptomyces sp. NPDC059742]|uniref:orotidine-5'-phosphate decarboxylase n=1 Tax=Streptomyces sp. NPDC059742 TaxID=3346927 RepID=UPI003655E7A2
MGLELLTSAGPGLARDLVGRGHEVFLDLKLFEIPNSVAGAVRAAGALGASMVTVHGMGGTGIMSAAVAAAREFPRLRVLALTVVTSMTGSDLADIGVAADTEEQVLRLARLAVGAGCDGVIASPREAGVLRGLLGPDRLIVTPGVVLEPEGAAAGGHARPGTPRAAFAAGASHVVVGRSVTRAADPVAALQRVRAAAG